MVSFHILGCLFAAGAATAAGARAQLDPHANRLIAWSHAASAAAGSVQHQWLTAPIQPCGPTQSVCTGVLGPAVQPWAGGTAWDPANGSVWVSDGRTLEALDPATCQPVCGPFPPTLPTPTALVTGLEVDAGHRVLWQVSSDGWIVGYDLTACPPQVIARCMFMLPTFGRTCGLAYDEVGGLLLVAFATFGAANPNNTVAITRRDNPCGIVCVVAVPDCGSAGPLGPLTGLAFDAGQQMLYATDGAQTVAGRLDRTGSACTFRPLWCCRNSGDPYFGLSLEPVPSRPVGQGCSLRPCPDCPGQAAVTVGDAVLGNVAFVLGLTAAPAGTWGVVALNAGGCHIPGLPVLCGELHVGVAPTPLLMGAAVQGPGARPCDGSATVALPLPADPSLWRTTWCAQWVVVCATGAGLGTGLSSAVVFPITR